MDNVHSWEDITFIDIVSRPIGGEFTQYENYSANPLLCHVSFHEFEPLLRLFRAQNEDDEDLKIDAHLRPPQFPTEQSNDEKRVQLRKYAWRKHPIARRSFAMFPPVSDLRFLRPAFQEVEDVNGEHGITLEHVVEAINKWWVKQSCQFGVPCQTLTWACDSLDNVNSSHEIIEIIEDIVGWDVRWEDVTPNGKPNDVLELTGKCSSLRKFMTVL